MELTIEDRLAITELVSLHGHLVDAGRLEDLDRVLTADVTYDVSALGGGILDGLAAVIEAGRALGDQNPLAHHVTNVVVDGHGGDGVAHVVSKGLAVMTDGSAASVVYDDRVVRTPRGWRVSERRVFPREQPLTP